MTARQKTLLAAWARIIVLAVGIIGGAVTGAIAYGSITTDRARDIEDLMQYKAEHSVLTARLVQAGIERDRAVACMQTELKFIRESQTRMEVDIRTVKNRWIAKTPVWQPHGDTP